MSEQEKPKLRAYFEQYSDNKNIVRVICSWVEKIENGDVTALAKGVALCSLTDCPNEKLGRQIAKGRAIKAIKRGCSCGKPMYSERAYNILKACNIDNVLLDDLFGKPKCVLLPIASAKVVAVNG